MEPDALRAASDANLMVAIGRFRPEALAEAYRRHAGAAFGLAQRVYTFPLDPKVYLIDHLPVRVSALEFVYTILIALGICTAATLVPSYWAARLLPADGVRYE